MRLRRAGDEWTSLAARLPGSARGLEVLDDVIQFLVELLERVPPTVEVVAEVSHERRRVRRLLEFCLRGAEQLRGCRVEFRAVGTLDRPSCGSQGQVLPFQREDRVEELPLLPHHSVPSLTVFMLSKILSAVLS